MNEFNDDVKATRNNRATIGGVRNNEVVSELREVPAQGSASSLSPQHSQEELLEAKNALEARVEELTSSLSLFSAAIESIADGLVVLDLAGRVVSYSAKFGTIWRFPDELLQRRDSRELMAYAAEQVKDAEQLSQVISNHLLAPQIATYHLLELKDGRAFERYGFPQWVNQQCVGVVVTFRDVTDRKRTEAALRINEEKYRLLWATAGDAFVLFDEHNTILEANAAVTTIFGYLPEEVIGQNIALLQPERFREGHRRGLQRYLTSGIKKIDWRAAEVLGLHRDGREIPIEIAFNHVRIEGKDLFAGFMRDISERKQTEAEREELLAREQRARDEAETANRLKDEFLATLSHELRTPLTSILGWSHMISGRLLSDKDKEHGLEIIQRNARRQSQLIEDILDVSSIITGKMRLEVGPVELSSVIENAVESVIPAAEAKDIRLHRLLELGDSIVMGDAGRLQQVIWNLLANAIKFTPRGGHVRIRLEHVDSHVEIIVADTGIGIDSEMLPYVFERFRQADQATTREHGGLGLGLAIVRHIVESHGGSVEAESAGKSEGATFTVKLPLTTVQQPEIATQDTEQDTEEDALAGSGSETVVEKVQFNRSSDLSGLHVLVVDDEDDTRLLLKTILESCDASVITASNVAEALEALKASRPHVIVSDLGMPREDGYSLIRKVRSLPAEEGGQTPAAALTAFATIEDRLRVLRSGFQMHLPKPIEPDELVAVVGNLAGKLGH